MVCDFVCVHIRVSCPGVIYAGPLTLRETHRIIADSFALVTSAPKPRSCTPVLEVSSPIIVAIAILSVRPSVRHTGTSGKNSLN